MHGILQYTMFHLHQHDIVILYQHQFNVQNIKSSQDNQSRKSVILIDTPKATLGSHGTKNQINYIENL